MPGRAQTLVAAQRAKRERDWRGVSAAFPRVAADEYTYQWLVVCTRGVYHESAATRLLGAADRVALVPVVDLFNHAEGAGGCGVGVGGACGAVTVTADRAYAAGEELRVCYGRHSGDVLLVEYGFLPAENCWDDACVDDALVPVLDRPQRHLLHAAGYLGNYVVDARTAACYRTQVALRLVACGRDHCKAFLDHGGAGTSESQDKKVDKLLVQVLESFSAIIHDKLMRIRSLDVPDDYPVTILTARWRQIDHMVSKARQQLGA